MATHDSGPRLPLEIIARIIEQACQSPQFAYERGSALPMLRLCRALVTPARVSVYARWYRERETELAAMTVDLTLRPDVASLVRDIEVNNRSMDEDTTEMTGMIALGVLAVCTSVRALTVTCPIASARNHVVAVLARLTLLQSFCLEYDTEPQDFMEWTEVMALVQDHWPQLRVLHLGLQLDSTASPIAPINHANLTTLRLYNPMSEAGDELFRLMTAMPQSLRRVHIVRDMQRLGHAIPPAQVVRALAVVAGRLEALEIYERTYTPYSEPHHPTQALATDSHRIIDAAPLLPQLIVLRSLALVGTITPASALRQIFSTVERLHLSCHCQALNIGVVAFIASGGLPNLRCVRARELEPENCPDGWTSDEYDQLKVRYRLAVALTSEGGLRQSRHRLLSTQRQLGSLRGRACLSVRRPLTCQIY